MFTSRRSKALYRFQTDTHVNGGCANLLISRMLTFVYMWSALGRSALTQLGMTCQRYPLRSGALPLPQKNTVLTNRLWRRAAVCLFAAEEVLFSRCGRERHGHGGTTAMFLRKISRILPKTEMRSVPGPSLCVLAPVATSYLRRSLASNFGPPLSQMCSGISFRTMTSTRASIPFALDQRRSARINRHPLVHS